MTVEIHKTQAKDGCVNCANVLGGVSSDVGLRCGRQYFDQPAWERKVEKLTRFPLVLAEDFCQDWRGKKV